jgi:hypothetical protein
MKTGVCGSARLMTLQSSIHGSAWRKVHQNLVLIIFDFGLVLKVASFIHIHFIILRIPLSQMTCSLTEIHGYTGWDALSADCM